MGISNRGLAAIAVLVCVLWGCIFAERLIVRRAIEATEIVLHSRPTVPVKYERPVTRLHRQRGHRSLPS